MRGAARLTPTAPRVQRKCDCAKGGDCECTGRKKLQKKARAALAYDFFEEEADRFAEQTAHRIDIGDPRIPGHDFSHVRIHDDANAHALADQQDARAFTYGSDIYFARGELSRPDARQLLAHELAHTVQQGAATTVRRKAADSCSEPHRLKLDVAQVWAGAWLDYVIGRLDRYVAAPVAAANEPVAASLRTYFTTEPESVQILRTRLDAMRGGVRGKGRARLECAPATEPQCQGHAAFAGGGRIDVCRHTLGWPDPAVTTVLLHELAHEYALNLGGRGLAIDRAYVSERVFALLSTEERFDNAESYAMFVESLSGEKSGFKPPPGDEIAGCGKQGPEIARAIARAERWNNDVVERLGTMGQDAFDSSFGALFPAPRPTLAAVRRVFTAAKWSLKEKLAIHCTRDSEHCPGNIAFFWRRGGPTAALQVCPAFHRVPEERRVFDAYRMIFQYTGRFTAAQASPYVELVQQIGPAGAAPRLPVEDRTQRVLPSDEAAYGALVSLASRASAALQESDDPRVRTLVGELHTNLIGRTVVVRFTAPAGDPPRYSSASGVLQVPPSGLSDGELMLGLLRETFRMRTAGLSEPTVPEVVTTQELIARENELHVMQAGLIDVLERAGVITDRPAAHKAIGKAAKAERAAAAAAPRTTIFPVIIGAAGNVTLNDGSDDFPSLGTLPPGMRERADVEVWVASAVRSRAKKHLAAAAAAGSAVITFRIYQYEKKLGEVEVRP